MTSCHVIRVSVHKNGCAKLSRTLRHYPFFKDAILVSGSIPHIINLHDSLWENYNVKGCRCPSLWTLMLITRHQVIFVAPIVMIYFSKSSETTLFHERDNCHSQLDFENIWSRLITT